MSIISNCTSAAIKNAAAKLIKGNLIAFPTETVYGLGANATLEAAIKRIYKVKNRPPGHPLIVHISSIKYLNKWARRVPEYALNLAEAHWPGPMTLILPRTNLAKDFITGGQDNVGVRVPAHNLSLALIKEFENAGGNGIAAPSANRFGAVSPTSASAVEIELGDYLGEEDLILDGGPCLIGVESTIIDCTQNYPTILRPGGLSIEMISETLGIPIKTKVLKSNANQIKTSGMLEAHYSPKAKVVLNGVPSAGDGLIALNSVKTPSGVVRLASPRDNEEYAKILYSAFRQADTKKLGRIYVIPPTGAGIAVAINDRLMKASFEK